MTDTKEFNKSLDRIAKALGGEEWSPEDKPEAIYKLLDKIADKLEERDSGSSGGGSSEPLMVGGGSEGTVVTLNKTWNEINEAFLSGRSVLLDNNIFIDPEYINPNNHEYSVLISTGEIFDSGINRVDYTVKFGRNSNSNNVTLYCNDKDDYPEASFD